MEPSGGGTPIFTVADERDENAEQTRRRVIIVGVDDSAC
jgi:hypothetical protein